MCEAIGLRLWSRLFIGLEVKVDKKTEIACQKCAAEYCSSFTTSAVGDVRQMGPAGRSKM
jgi:hypothetical protein